MLELLAATTASAPGEKFVLFGALHLGILAATLGVPWILSRCTRRQRRPHLARCLAGFLAAILVIVYLFAVGWAVHVGKITRWPSALPLQLCDWAAAAAVLALIWRRQQAYELAYFWGLSGTFQALLTPDVSENFPNPLFIAFFISHCGIVVSILFLTWGLDFRPQPGAVRRAWVWSQVYLAVAGLVNWTLHTNFGYLGAKPPHPSLLDFFGPWPWYLLTLEVIALLFYTIFYAPFWISDRRRAAP